MSVGLDTFFDDDSTNNDDHGPEANGQYDELSSSGRVEHPWHRDSGIYTEQHEIGTGAYGKVLRGVNNQTGESVAVKKITLPISEEGVPQSVIREVSLLKRFERDNHANIVKLLDVCHGLSSDGRRLYINLVFEYCPRDLAMFLESAARDSIPLSDSTIRRLVNELALGVKYLHDQAVVHRDLKPQNVLMTATGQLKIADYGLARMYSLQSALTTVVVTLWYRSPELLLQCDYGFSVDIWSIGCMMAEMFRLRPLFPGANEVDQLKRIFEVTGLPTPHTWPSGARVARSSFETLPITSSLRQKVVSAPPWAYDLIQKLLALSADDRLTIGEILEHQYFSVDTPTTLANCSTSVSSTSSSSCSSSDDSGF